MSEIGIEARAFENQKDILSARFGKECKTIGESAFKSSSIENFNEDNNITKICDYAFYGCENLTEIILPECEIIGVNTFEGCKNLKYISYNNIKEIGERAFFGCDSLTNITIPSNLTTIGKRAFVGCENIGTIIVDDKNSKYDSREDCNAIIEDTGNDTYTLIQGCKSTKIPYSVTIIGNNAFESIWTLPETIDIPNRVTSIGDNAFYGCNSLTSITIPNSVTSIGGSAFSNCTKLTDIEFNAEKCVKMGSKEHPVFKCVDKDGNISYPVSSVTIGTSVVDIPEYAFYGCSKIDSIEIPSSVTTIGTSAFEGCNIKTIYNFSNKMTFVKESTDYGYIAVNADTIYNYSGGSKIGDYLFDFDEINGYILVKYIGNDKELELPDSCNGNNYTIGANVFNGNKTITSVEIPNGVTSIGERAFFQCSSLTSVTIANGVRSIGSYAFYECKFEELNIPQSVETIGVKAFVGCRQINKITVDKNNLYYRVDDNAIIERKTNTLIFGCKSTKEISIENIGSFAFEGCSGLGNIKILNGVKKIGEAAFYGCTGLQSNNFEIPESITEIGGHAFYKCNITNVKFNAVECTTMGNSLQPVFKNVDKDGNISETVVSSVTIGKKVTNIPAYAFYNCSKIKSIDIPNTVKSIGTSAFEKCGGIKTVKNYSISFKLEKGTDSNGYVARYANNVYNYFTINNFNFINENGVNTLVKYTGSNENINLPIISLKNYKGEKYIISSDVFKNNTTITTLTIPADSVTSIGEGAFSGCTNLKTIFNYSNITLTKGKYGLGDNIVKIINAPDGFEYQSAILFFNESGGITFANYSGTANKYTIPEKYAITNITSIGDYAFVGNRSIQTIEIPNTITTIGNYAFKGVGGINTIIVGNSVSSIGEEAFYGCNIKTIYNFSNLTFEKGSNDYGYIAEKAETIYNYSGGSKEGDYLFDYDETNNKYVLAEYIGSDSNLYLPNNCKGESYTIGENKFKDNKTITKVIIQGQVKSIGKGAFSNCDNLTSVEFNAENCETMGFTANPVFQGCKALSTITIGENVKNIPTYAFMNCSKITNITIPSSVTSIGSYAFDGCSGLTSVEFNAENCTYKGDSYTPMFSDCTALSTVTIGENVKRIPEYAFMKCTKITSIKIPNSVTSIEDYAFNGCSGLTSVVIPDNVTSIGSSAFSGCYSLTSVTIGNSVEKIGWSAFRECKGLTSVEIPDSVTSISACVFYNCTNLQNIYLHGTTPPDIGTSVFVNVKNNFKIYVPKGSGNIYKEKWTAYSNYIVEQQ